MVGGMEESTITKNTHTHKEDGQAAPANTAVKMGCAYPIWTGVITKSWIWLLGWGGITDTKITKFTTEKDQHSSGLLILLTNFSTRN